MKKRNTKWLWIALAVVLAVGGIGAAVYFTQANKEPVFVYGFQDGIAGMTDYYEGGSDSSGMVTTDRVQPVRLTETQSVLEIRVTEGQQVKKGDVLFTYDTTLSDLALLKKDLGVQQAKLDLQTAEKELRVIKSYIPIRYYTVDQSKDEQASEPVKDLADFDVTGKEYLIFSGSGSTALTPMYCWIRSTAMVDDKMMETICQTAGSDVVFLVLRTTSQDRSDGGITGEFGVKLMRLKAGEGYTYRFSVYDPYAVRNPGNAMNPGVEWNSGYTAAEIAKMKEEKQAQIKDLEFKIKIEEAELKIMQKEAASGEVLAEFDGKIMGLMDPETAASTGQPLMKVSGGGGFYVEGQVSELQLGSVQPGMTVNIMSWDTGMSYVGTVVEVGEFPADNQQYYYGGSQNVSYFPYKVFIDESADLQDGMYVSMNLQKAQGEGSLYIENAFVRTEGAVNYVYARGADGRLEKRVIQTGKNLWGSYLEVRGGLTKEDFVAFPYGKTVKAGAPTQEGTREDLYDFG